MSRTITRLEISKIMRLSAVEIDPKGNVIIIGGDNAQGKTSVLDSIAMAIGGKRLCPPEPINTGENEASIVVELGDLTIGRKFWRMPDDPTDVRSSLSVRDASGAQVKSPQAVLDALVGSLAFDPLEFAEMKQAEQSRTLRELVGLDVEQLEEEQARVFSLRTEKGREKRDAEAVVEDMAWYEEVPELRSITEISSRMRAAVEAAQTREEKIGYAKRCAADVNQLESENSDRKAQLGRLELAIASAERELEDTREVSRIAETDRDACTVPDLDPIQAELEDVEIENAAIRHKMEANKSRAARVEFAEQMATGWKEMDTRHARITEDIRQRTAAVKYPIPGLELRKEGVYYQDVPFSQGSRYERIKVSVVMGVALNPEFRVMLIRDGSVIDDKSMAIIANIAEEEECQFWIEMARGYEDQPGAILIEDGAVKS